MTRNVAFLLVGLATGCGVAACWGSFEKTGIQFFEGYGPGAATWIGYAAVGLLGGAAVTLELSKQQRG